MNHLGRTEPDESLARCIWTFWPFGALLPMPVFARRPLTGGTLLLTLALSLASCSSCEVPREPVLPADITGRWEGAYTLYDGGGRPLTDSLWLTLDSDRGEVSGDGVRKRILPGQQPMESLIEIDGSVVINTFRIELIDPETRNRAVFSGKVEGDTLAGQLSVDGTPMGDLKMVGHRK